MGRRIQVLGDGFVELIDHMGDDEAVEQAARVSYAGTRDEARVPTKTRALIRYLMAHRHTSPFEMVEFKFAIKVPIFVWRQWIRHRTASVNEISGRYAQLPSESYLPELERLQKQADSNHQGSGPELVDNPQQVQASLREEQALLFENYQAYIDTGLAKEISRINLPLSVYTEAYWKMDLHNLFHFLALRQDSHAQYEIRVCADAIAELIKDIVPFSWEAYEDYVKGSQKFSRMEMEILQRVFWSHENDPDLSDGSYWAEQMKNTGMTQREIDSFRTKVAPL